MLLKWSVHNTLSRGAVQGAHTSEHTAMHQKTHDTRHSKQNTFYKAIHKMKEHAICDYCTRHITPNMLPTHITPHTSHYTTHITPRTFQGKTSMARIPRHTFNKTNYMTHITQHITSDTLHNALYRTSWLEARHTSWTAVVWWVYTSQTTC